MELVILLAVVFVSGLAYEIGTKRRENSDEVASLKAQLAEAADERERLQTALEAANSMIATLQENTFAVDKETLRAARSMCHPDRHGNSRKANAVMAWLNTLRVA